MSRSLVELMSWENEDSNAWTDESEAPEKPYWTTWRIIYLIVVIITLVAFLAYVYWATWLAIRPGIPPTPLPVTLEPI